MNRFLLKTKKKIPEVCDPDPKITPIALATWIDIIVFMGITRVIDKEVILIYF